MLRENLKVLVVDDVNAMLVQVTELLYQSGFIHVVSVDNGKSALEEIQGGSYHLVLCDWHMSQPDGLEILKQIRRSPKPEVKGIPFIMVTAENAAEKVIEAIGVGVDEYLLKPLTPAQIEQKVKKVLINKKVLT